MVYSETTPEEERAFRAYSQAVMVRGVAIASLTFIAGAVLVWPTDYLLFWDSPEVISTFRLWRLTVLAVGVVAIGLCQSSVSRGRLFLPTVASAYTFLIFVIAWTASDLGGLEQPFFYYSFLFTGVFVLYLVDLPTRLVLMGVAGLVFWAGFFVPHPEHLEHKFLWSVALIYLGALVIFAMIGHVIYHLMRTTYFDRQALARSRAMSERLLLNVLPGPIADRLKRDEGAIANIMTSVTVMFIDIVGFTPLSAALPPEQVVGFLNELFSEMDAMAERYDLEKIKTIGDAYLVAGGLPEPREDHAQAVARMALDLVERFSGLEGPHGKPLQVRIGVHSGPVVAGVIGVKKFSYDVWGDTVNTASRMESHGIPGRIQVSAETRALLESDFSLERRGEIEVKGKGTITTWFLTGRKD